MMGLTGYVRYNENFVYPGQKARSASEGQSGFPALALRAF
jgi:hypothetical protein